jgi:TRAP-type C4-dicarboxylate transport system permease large subunit
VAGRRVAEFNVPGEIGVVELSRAGHSRIPEPSATLQDGDVLSFIVAAASIFGWMLTATGVTADIAAWVLAFTNEAWVFLLLANLLMLFVGCFLEPTAAITILVPILLPIAVQLGIDPVHFGLVVCVTACTAMITPPFGLDLFVASSTLNKPVVEVTRGVGQFIVANIVVLLIVTYVPGIATFLPNLLFGKG